MTHTSSAVETGTTPLAEWSFESSGHAADAFEVSEVVAAEYWWQALEQPADEAPGEANAPMAPPWRRIPVPRAGGVVAFVPVEAVVWLEAVRQYVRIHAVEGSYLRRGSLSELGQRLPMDTFVRIHRTAVVNVDRVAATQRENGERRWAILADGSRLPVSARHWGLLCDALAGAGG